MISVRKLSPSPHHTSDGSRYDQRTIPACIVRRSGNLTIGEHRLAHLRISCQNHMGLIVSARSRDTELGRKSAHAPTLGEYVFPFSPAYSRGRPVRNCLVRTINTRRRSNRQKPTIREKVECTVTAAIRASNPHQAVRDEIHRRCNYDDRLR